MSQTMKGFEYTKPTIGNINVIYETLKSKQMHQKYAFNDEL